jgi:hypothetical protein
MVRVSRYALRPSIEIGQPRVRRDAGEVTGTEVRSDIHTVGDYKALPGSQDADQIAADFESADVATMGGEIANAQSRHTESRIEDDAPTPSTGVGGGKTS